MKKIILILTLLSMFSLTLSAYSSERNVNKYRENFCRDKTTQELQKQHDEVNQANDAMIKKGSEACEKNDRQSISDCRYYRFGKVRKEIQKNKTILKAIELELESRKEQK